MLPALDPILPLTDFRPRAVEYSGDPGPKPDSDAEPAVRSRMLTVRQESIAAMIAHGLTCPDIAEALHVPLRTVEGHADRILEALGLYCLEDLTDDVIGRYRRSVEGAHYGELAHPYLVADPSGQQASPALLASQDLCPLSAQHSPNDGPHNASNTSELGPEEAARPMSKQASVHTLLHAPVQTSGRTPGQTSGTAGFGR